MNKYPLLFLISILLYSCTPLNTIQTAASKKSRYLDKLEPGSKLLQSAYHYTEEKTTDNKFIYKRYYPSNRLMTDFITYADAKGANRNGLCIRWYDNGNKHYEGHYKNDKQDGEWKYYRHKTGKIYSFGPFSNGSKEGVWTSLDSLGQISSEYTYDNGKSNGPYKIYKHGKVVEKGNCLKGDCKSNEKIESDVVTEVNTIEKYTLVEDMPYLAECENKNDSIQKACSDRMLLASIYKNIRYPEIARREGLEGKALIRFYIDENGELKEPVVLRGLCDEIKNECLRVVDLLPQWRPGMQDGKAVKVYFNLPLRFKLE